MKKFYITISVLIAFCFSVQAQNGIVRGKVIDGTSGKPAISATVRITNDKVSKIATSDLDGAFSFTVPVGVYELSISLVGFDNSKVTGINVKTNDATVLPDVTLTLASSQLKEFVVTSQRLQKVSEESLTVFKRKSLVMLDGISSAKMKLIGDGTAVEAAKRVTGVSIEGGRYVYVRGLGDRYSKSTLNGLDIPGLDPDRNSLQMDIFPTALIDNITVVKNFLPNLPADFTGGLLNIETNDFPTRKIFNISASMSYNPDMHFKNNFLSGNKGGQDWLGMDDGTRALPALASGSNPIPTPVSGGTPSAVNSFVKSFSPDLGAQTTNSFSDFTFGFSVGDQINLNKKGNSGSKKLGYVAALSYRFDQRLYENVQYGESQKNINQNASEMVIANNLTGRMGEENVLIGALAGLAYKTNFSKIKFNVLRLQSGEHRAGKFDVFNNSDGVGQSGYIATSDNIEYGERSVTNFQLSGAHVLGKSGWKLDWAAGTTASKSTDPDIRKTAFTIDPGRTYFNAGAGGNPSRIWRYLDETNTSFKLDLEKKFSAKNTIRFGGLYLMKERNYEIRQFNIQFFGSQQPVWVNDPSLVLIDRNIYPSAFNNIYYVSGNNKINSNAYNSTVNNVAAYVLDELDVTASLKAIVGVRLEKYQQFHTGRDQRYASGDIVGGRNLENAKVLDNMNLFPSVNLIQKFGLKTNLRGSYTRTTARPSFKELSFAQILDPLTNRIFNGSLFPYDDWAGKLVPTMIDNLDIRWEKFYSGSEILSFSLFYKRFTDPIELVRIPQQQTSTEYQPRNVGNANLFGAEVEINKSLSFISSTLEKISFNTNITVVQSSVTMTDLEFNARKAYEKSGENLKSTRKMAGQSPYIVNAGFTYTDSDKGISSGLFYNVKGATLTIVGSGLFPDVYTLPYHNLNFSFNKTFGKDKKFNFNFRTDNILNDNIDLVFRAYNAKDQVFSSLSPRRSFTVGFSYKF
jgi:TonB-dependent receptor